MRPINRGKARNEDVSPLDSLLEERNRCLVWVVCGLLLLAVGLVFGQTVRHDFINLDDPEYVSENPHVTQGLSAEGIVWALTHRHHYNWCPLTWWSYMLDSQFYGPKPWGCHLTNVLLHAATAIVLFLVLRRMTGRFWPSALVAALFAVHPLRAESVAWVTERKDMLSGLFFTLTLWAYVGYVRHQFSPARYLGIMFLFALGLMAKPAVATLPAVLLLLDYWPLRRFSHPSPFPLQIVLEKVPLLTLAAASCALRLWAQSEPGAPYFAYIPLFWRIGNALVSYAAYLRQFFWPTGLALWYPFLISNLPEWKIWGSFALLMVITAGSFVGRRKYPYVLVGWLWYLGMLALAIGVVQFGPEAMADRFTYLPQIGLCIALAWGAADLARSGPYGRWACGVASALVLAILMGWSWRQTSFWRDSETLWTRTLACTSSNALAHNGLGAALASQGRLDEAVAHYHKALEITPDDFRVLGNLGRALAEQGRLDEAVQSYREALAINPGRAGFYNDLGESLRRQGRLAEAMAQFQQALAIKPDFAEAYCNLGLTLAGCGRFDEAIVHYQKALEIRPEYAEAHDNLGTILAERGQLDEARAHYQKALKIKPDDAQLHDNLGNVLASQRKFHEAIAHYREALRLAPSAVQALNALAWVLATSPEASLRSGAEAVSLAQRAARLSGGREPEILDTLAAAYAEAGRFPEALQTARKALQLATEQKKKSLADSLHAKIRLYESGTPYRESSTP